jgi:alpha-glucosidase
VRKSNEALRFGEWKPLIHYPEDYLVYLRQTPDQSVLVLINFSEEKPLHLDLTLGDQTWWVLLSTEYPEGEPIHLPKLLAPYEVSILHNQETR